MDWRKCIGGGASGVLFWPLVTLLLISGVLQPILIEEVRYCGAGEPLSLLYMIPNYLGMLIALFIPQRLVQRLEPTRDTASVTAAKKDQRTNMRLFNVSEWPRVARILLVATLDVFSFTGCFVGMLLCGSSFYTIIYSSCTALVAILARIMLGRRLWISQWLSVIIVTGGLVTVGISAFLFVSSGGHGEDPVLVGVGIAIVSIGTFLHANMYIANDACMRRGSDPLSPIRLCGWVGLYGLIVVGIWIFAYTVPRWESLVVDPLRKSGTQPGVVVLLYLGLMVADLVHDATFYVLLGKVGSVTTGVLKGLTAITVFVVSSFAFCARQPSQCFTWLKGLALGLVVFGVVFYSVASHRRGQAEAKANAMHVNEEEEKLVG